VPFRGRLASVFRGLPEGHLVLQDNCGFFWRGEWVLTAARRRGGREIRAGERFDGEQMAAKQRTLFWENGDCSYAAEKVKLPLLRPGTTNWTARFILSN